MPRRLRFPVVGCNMNDKSYPFRGEYKVEPVLNHGHGGALPKGNTDLMLRISGSNLSIEKIQQRKGQTMHCELSVDNGPPRAVIFPLGGEAVVVPGDGREYHLTAVVQAGGVKNSCRMVLKGSEGKSLLRLRAPLESPLAENIVLKVDGVPISSEKGWYAIPIQAKECSLELADTGRRQRRASHLIPERASLHQQSVRFIVQTVEGKQGDAVLFCSGSSEAINVVRNQPITVAADSGPFIFQLPVASRTTSPQLPPPPTPQAHSGMFTPSHDKPIETATTDFAAFVFPELETKIVQSSGDTAAPVFVATAEGFTIELVGDNGASVSGNGSARLCLPDRKEHCVRITIKDASGRIFLRQRTTVPELAGPVPAVDISKEPYMGRVVSERAFQHATADIIPQVGSETTLVTPEAVSRQPAAGSATETWILQFSKALQYSDPQSVRRAVQSIVPQTPEAAIILGFFLEQLSVAPPVMCFRKKNEKVMDIQCPGFDVMAAVDNEPPRNISGEGSVQVPDGHSVTLSAHTIPKGRTAAACRVYFQPQEPNLDELLLARLVETLQRHSTSPEKIVLELRNVTSPQSVNGSRFLSLFVECLQRFLDVYKNPCHLFVSDVPEGIKLLAAFDDGQQQQQPIELFSNSSMNIAPNVTKVRLSVAGKATLPEKEPRNEFAKSLLDAFYRQSSLSPLSACLSSVISRGPEEKALVDLLLQQNRDHENELSRLRLQGAISPSIEAIQFISESGSLKNIRTKGPCQLSVDIDGTGFVNIEQGGQVPQGYAFPSGSVHCVRIAARDRASSAICAETQVTLIGAKTEDAASHTSLPTASPFLDATVSQVMDEVHLHLVCPQRLSIVCDVDGNNCGDAGRSDVTAKMSSTHPHNVNVRLVDGAGNVVFEQRLVLPPIMAQFWSLRLEGASLQVDNVSGDSEDIVLKASVDRALEKNFVDPLLFDSNTPHTILLRRYFRGKTSLGTCAGELSLSIPPFVDSAHVQELSYAYKSAWPLGANELRSRLKELRSRVTSNVLKELISLLIDFAIECRSSAYSGGGGSSARVHFRLAGDESTFARSHVSSNSRPKTSPLETLLDFLCTRFPYLSRDAWVRHINAGHLSVSSAVAKGLTTTADYVLQQNDEISFSPPRELEPEVDERILVVQEDEALIVCVKNGNLPVAEGGRYSSNTLVGVLQRRGDDGRSGPILCRPVHRLDKETSGLVVLAKDPTAARILSRQFEEQSERLTAKITRLSDSATEVLTAAAFAELFEEEKKVVTKSYVAVLAGAAPEGAVFHLCDRIGPLSACHPGAGVVDAESHLKLKKLKMACFPASVEENPQRYGRPACSRVYVLASDAAIGVSVARVDIITGRTHQIRLHCAQLGFPLLGEKLYETTTPGLAGGCRPVADDVYISRARSAAGVTSAAAAHLRVMRHLLHATFLSFYHPTTGERLVFFSDPREWFLRDVVGNEKEDGEGKLEEAVKQTEETILDGFSAVKRFKQLMDKAVDMLDF